MNELVKIFSRPMEESELVVAEFYEIGDLLNETHRELRGVVDQYIERHYAAIEGEPTITFTLTPTNTGRWYCHYTIVMRVLKWVG